MQQMLIALACCGLMAGILKLYLMITKKKYYDGHDQPSLSNTFYKTGWKFRALLIGMAILLVYPILLANGYYDGAWHLTAPSSLLAWGKFAYAICMGGIIGVALNADFMKKEAKPHVIAASIVAAGGAMAGTCLRHGWEIAIGVGVWLAWLVYYLIKNYRNNKAGNPSAIGLYVELVAFYSVPTCLVIYILLNYFA